MDLHRSDVGGQTLLAVGNTVRYIDEAGMRNIAAETLPEMGFTSGRVDGVLGIAEGYMSMLPGRARREGSAALTRRRDRPDALGSGELAQAGG